MSRAIIRTLCPMSWLTLRQTHGWSFMILCKYYPFIDHVLFKYFVVYPSIRLSIISLFCFRTLHHLFSVSVHLPCGDSHSVLYIPLFPPRYLIRSDPLAHVPEELPAHSSSLKEKRESSIDAREDTQLWQCPGFHYLCFMIATFSCDGGLFVCTSAGLVWKRTHCATLF